jgi:hypothetical protein
MHRKAVHYKGVWLDPNSKAFELHKEGKTKELDQLLSECRKKAEQLEQGK